MANLVPRVKTKIVIIVGAALVVALAAATVFFFKQYMDLKNNPEAAAKDNTQRIVTKVGKLYALPSEEPTVAQVKDKEKVKEQSFFKNAENNDYILVYPDTKVAILYRESQNKIINVGPVSAEPENQQTPGTTTTPSTPKQ